jgi:UDP-glucose 4-epimerase
MNRWLITGGCGFIGRNLIDQLLAQPEVTIRVVDNLSVGTRQDLAGINSYKERALQELAEPPTSRLELVVGDITDDGLASRVVRDTDVVVHLAANSGVAASIADPRGDCMNNVVGTLNCLEACRQHRVRRFVFASSGAPIGNCEPPLHEEMPAHPVSPYGASKLAGEAYCSAYQRSFGVETVVLRFGNCYGPFSSHKSSVVAKFIRQALAQESWKIFGDGQQTRDFIYVHDVIDAILRAATVEGIGGEVFQIATNSETTVLDLAAQLAKVLANHRVAVPGIRNANARVGDVMRNYSDTRKARVRLGWIPHVPLEEGLDHTVQWFLQARSSQ